jgi:outer membrane receptor for ferrienterochelin and colicin
VVWSPEWSVLKGFTTNVDFWRVERDGTALIDHQNVLDRWHAAGDSNAGLLAGERVILDSGGNIEQVVAAYQNAGSTIADGVDIGAAYLLNTNNIGRFDFAVGFSYLHSFRQASIPGAPLLELVDTTQDGEGQDAYLKRKARADVTWTYKGLQTGVAANFTDGFANFDLSGNDVRTASTWTFDLRVAYTLDSKYGAYLKGTTVSVGAKNFLDRDPPLSQYFGANPNNYPGHIYTSEGRIWYVSMDKKF